MRPEFQGVDDGVLTVVAVIAKPAHVKPACAAPAAMGDASRLVKGAEWMMALV